MSGGHFEYLQYRFTDLGQEVENLINLNGVQQDYGYKQDYSEVTLQEFRKCVKLVKEAQVYLQRIDWLVCGDDGEETFHSRLKEDLSKLE